MFTSLGIEIPRPGETKWYYRSCTIGVIFEKYEMLLTALEEIVEKPQSWDDATLTQASGLLQQLNSFLFCFLLFLFNKVLEQSSILNSIPQNTSTNFSFRIEKIKTVVALLTDLRSDDAFDDLLSSTIDMAGQPSSRSDKKHNYKQIYFELLDTIIAMLNDRFADSQSFEFLDSFNPFLF